MLGLLNDEINVFFEPRADRLRDVGSLCALPEPAHTEDQ
jgi:hypothetical protein